MNKYILASIGVILAVIVGLLIIRAGLIGISDPTQKIIQRKLEKESEVLRRHHLLPDPNESPNSLRSYAEKGFRIIVDTQTLAKEYVGSALNCTNCHFAAGDTTGGSQGGLSLAGVAAKYPALDASVGKVLSLEGRINSCFERSMNGSPLPLDSDLMLSLVVYLHWISDGMPIYATIPWLGLKPLKTEREGDPESGKRLFHTYCAICHRDDGQGTEHNPPLWGTKSFNSRAGMHVQKTLAAFIYWNMPYEDATPVLTEEQAQDVAAYILVQPRPQ